LWQHRRADHSHLLAMNVPITTTPFRIQRRTLVAAIVCSVVVASCGGGDSGGSGVTPAPGVDGPAWWGYGRDAQHTAQGAIATQDLNRIAWMTPVDLAPPRQNGALLIHYGTPVVTSHNTVVVPVKTTAAGGFRVEARSGVNGGQIWSALSDYVLPPHNWVPSYGPALTTTNRLFFAGSGGRLWVKDDADTASGAPRSVAFYGLAAYQASPAAFDASVFVNTPVTVDAQGNAYFGFVVTAANPAGLVSGIARVDANGVGTWASASFIAGDAAIEKVAMNSAPALSPDGKTVYIAVNTAAVAGTVQAGYLVALDSSTFAVQARTVLVDPSTAGLPARISDDSSASPTVGPDGDVYFGVLERTFGSHNARGWLLHFNASLAPAGAPGSFGWDTTPSIVPATMVPSYSGGSSYLLMTKYNNYAGVGSGDGANRVAVIDPRATQTDAISGLAVMREVLTILGPTFESGTSGPVREWCINTAAVDPATKSILVNSEDGFLYRWDLVGNRFSQKIQLTSGVGEAYTPTAIGADGAVYAINNAVLFSIGR